MPYCLIVNNKIANDIMLNKFILFFWQIKVQSYKKSKIISIEFLIFAKATLLA